MARLSHIAALAVLLCGLAVALAGGNDQCDFKNAQVKGTCSGKWGSSDFNLKIAGYPSCKECRGESEVSFTFSGKLDVSFCCESTGSGNCVNGWDFTDRTIDILENKPITVSTAYPHNGRTTFDETICLKVAGGKKFLGGSYTDECNGRAVQVYGLNLCPPGLNTYISSFGARGNCGNQGRVKGAVSCGDDAADVTFNLWNQWKQGGKKML